MSSTITKRFSTFYVDRRYCGIEVTRVQEVTQRLRITPLRLAPAHIRGLINLRGGIATAIDLNELFSPSSRRGGEPRVDEGESGKMTVVCRTDEALISLLVDEIGDVIELNPSQFEAAPETLEPNLKKLLSGVYKTQLGILSVLDVEQLIHELNQLNRRGE